VTGRDRDREYTVDGLRAGDQVRVDVRAEGRRLYASQVSLEGAGAPGASGFTTVEGTVERILPERGFLELRTLNGDLITVYVPESSSATVRNRFNRIREGDQVRLEGERLSEDRLELIAFR
jgi:translation initiation factor IF-1